MQQIDLTAAKAAKATERRALAVLAYDNGKAEPAGANWQGIADLLRLALPAAKPAKASAADSAELGGAEPWADYAIPATATKKLGKSPVIAVTFACGAVVRAPAVSLPGKPVNIGRGLRIAFTFYRARIARQYAGASVFGSDCVNVPDIVSIICDATAAEYNAADCNAKTADYRRGGFDHVALAAEAEALPLHADDGGLNRGAFYRAHYRLAEARRDMEGADTETAAELGARIEDCELRLAGMSALEISARRRGMIAEARKAAEAAAKAERDAAYAAERDAAEAEAPRLRLVVNAEAEAPAEQSPDAPSESAVPDAPSAPVAPRLGARFLAGTSLASPMTGIPVAPSCILRVA